MEVFSTKILDHELIELSLQIDDVEGNVQLMGHPPRILHICDATTPVRMSLCLPRLLSTPNAHGYADDVIPFLEEEIGSEAAIDTSTHRDKGSLSIFRHRFVHPSGTSKERLDSVVILAKRENPKLGFLSPKQIRTSP